MEISKDPIVRLDMLVKALSEMTKHLGYKIAAVFNHWELNLYMFDEKKNCVALLCDVPYRDSKESSAEALLRRYESRNSWRIFFFDSFDSVTFPGGTLEEIELKVAVGVKALFNHSDTYPKNFFDGL